MAGKKYKERFADKMAISISREFEHKCTKNLNIQINL